MEKDIGIDKLSNVYTQLDQLTSDEKSKVIEYLTKNLSAKHDLPIEKTQADLVDAIESNEHREKITPNDVSIYIHGNPRGHQTFGEIDNRQKDPLLSHFDKYYTGLIKSQQILEKKLGDGSTEYTIVEPSREVIGRGGGYFGLTIILKNGYKIKDGSIDELMQALEKYFIEDCNIIAQSGTSLQWTNDNKESIRKTVLKVKNVFINSMNQEKENKGLIVKNK